LGFAAVTLERQQDAAAAGRVERWVADVVEAFAALYTAGDCVVVLGALAQRQVGSVDALGDPSEDQV
jgi:hypothetical protein